MSAVADSGGPDCSLCVILMLLSCPWTINFISWILRAGPGLFHNVFGMWAVEDASLANFMEWNMLAKHITLNHLLVLF